MKLPNEIYIFSGAKQIGKTSALKQWILTHNCEGILTPVSEGQRYFMDITTWEFFEMEARDDEESIDVGRYKFSAAAFKKAEDIIRKGIESDAEWLIIDEIGPLELQEKGFYSIAKTAIEANNQKKILLVVRDEILEDVLLKFNIINYFDFQGRD